MTRPHVVVHVAISLDGSTAGFDADVGRFYALARTWDEDVTLAGADTILAQEKALSAAPRPGPTADAPLLAVVDGRGRVTQWDALRECGHWRGVVALRAEGRPAATGEAAVTELVTPGERVDLAEALGMLADREGARVIRVDSGGTLTGALLRADLVDEISLLVHPCLVGSGDRRWHGPDPAPPLPLEPLAGEQLDDLVWLRYRVRRDT
jgi:2,5-diamino-6-(ribosylamino)-4(3H)-pyrimidinone 5'-phosphate reductase